MRGRIVSCGRGSSAGTAGLGFRGSLRVDSPSAKRGGNDTGERHFHRFPQQRTERPKIRRPWRVKGLRLTAHRMSKLDAVGVKEWTLDFGECLLKRFSAVHFIS